MFDGVGSPCTQTFGLGIFADTTADHLGEIENFFADRGSDTHHEVSPLADPSLWPLLVKRGYHPIEFSNVMWRPTADAMSGRRRRTRIDVRKVAQNDLDVWVETTVRGWSEFPEVGDYLLDIGPVIANQEGGVLFLAEIDGAAVGAAAVAVHQGVVLLAGACTIPEARRRGAQSALLDARLNYSREHGCDIAMICAAPGSASQRNAERNGFRIAYTRCKWALNHAARQ